MRLAIPLLVLLFCGTAFAEIEIVQDRTINQKVFDMGSGQKRYQIHGKPLHYQNVEGEGDWLDIDINFTDQGLYWEVEKGLFKVQIRKGASGNFVRFQNRTGEFLDSGLRAVGYWDRTSGAFEILQTVNNVQGSVVNGHTVQWQNVFNNTDLEITYDTHKLKENIYVKQAARDNLPDPASFGMTAESTFLVFATEVDFDNLTLPNKPAEGWDSEEKLEFRDAGGKLRFFFPVTAAFASNNPQNFHLIRRKLIKRNEKWWLLTGVPLSWVNEQPQGTIVFDPPTSYYAGAGDGYASKTSINDFTEQTAWNNAHDATTATSVDYTAASTVIQTIVVRNNKYTFLIRRSFFPIDTSGIDDAATISAATLNLYATGAASDHDNDAQGYITVVQTSQASTSEIVSADYDNCGDVNNPTQGTDANIDLTNVSGAGYVSMALNATGIGWIDKTGVTQLGAREGHDAEDAIIATCTPTNDCLAQNGITISTSEETGTSQDPYLEVTTAAAGPKKGAVIITS